VRIDHVIYAAADLDEAAARIERELGLAVHGGGRHEGLGTHNRIVPLGGGYLELLAIADPDEAAGSDLGRALLARDGDGLCGWAVAVDDVEPVARRLGTPVTTISRSGLSARLTFFISRDHDSLDPGAGSDAGGITWLEVAGDAARLERWLDCAGLPIRTVDGPPAVRAVGIGERELR
jgi:Glyoxalase-like domain